MSIIYIFMVTVLCHETKVGNFRAPKIVVYSFESFNNIISCSIDIFVTCLKKKDIFITCLKKKDILMA